MSEQNSTIKKAERLATIATLLLVFAGIGVLFLQFDPELSFFKSDKNNTSITVQVEEDEDRIENGIHVKTGLKDAEGMMTVVNNCTNCHSAKLIMQNRMNKERWNTTIKWMQETQNLWDLGKNQEIIVDYLVKNYPILKKGRREVLRNIAWYDLQN